MFFEGKKVLILGGAGLWGSALIRALLPLGAKIRATEHRTDIDAEYRRDVEVRRGNLLETPRGGDDLFEGIDIVFHCAAMVGGAKTILSSPSQIMIYNVNLAGQMMYRATQAGVERFSFVSSSYVYPDYERKPATEDEGFIGDPPDIHFGIGWANRYMEKVCQHFHRTTKTRFAIARPTAYYGPRDDFSPDNAHVIPALIRKAVEKQNPFEVWGNGQDERCFTYVDDLVDGMLELVQNYACADPVNITYRKSHTVDDVWRTLFDILGYRYYTDNQLLPPYAPGEIRVIHNTHMPSVTPFKVSCAQKARTLLGFECTTTLKEGLRKTVDWYLAHGRTNS